MSRTDPYRDRCSIDFDHNVPKSTHTTTSKTRPWSWSDSDRNPWSSKVLFSTSRCPSTSYSDPWTSLILKETVMATRHVGPSSPRTIGTCFLWSSRGRGREGSRTPTHRRTTGHKGKPERRGWDGRRRPRRHKEKIARETRESFVRMTNDSTVCLKTHHESQL